MKLFNNMKTKNISIHYWPSKIHINRTDIGGLKDNSTLLYKLGRLSSLGFLMCRQYGLISLLLVPS